MKQIAQLFLLSLATMLYCGCQSLEISSEVQQIITKVRQVRDPQGKLAKIESQVMKGEFRNNTKDKPMTMEIAVKQPNMMRITVIVPGETAFIKAYDGKQGWFFSTNSGVNEVTGKQLDELKLQAYLMSPIPKLSDIFESITLGEDSVEVGEECYTLICTPKAEFHSQPITYYISKKSYKILKREEEIDSAKGKIVNAITVFNNYEPSNGILVPRNIVSFRDGKLMEFNVKSIQWNAKLNKSDFTMPEKLQ